METIASFSRAEEAHLLRMRLESVGFAAYVQDENTIQIDSFYSNATERVRVEVSDEDAAAVREFLAADHGGPATPDAPAAE